MRVAIAGVLIAGICAGCQPRTTTGLSTGLVVREIERSFDAEVAPVIAARCTPAEVSLLRSASVNAASAVNTGDLSSAVAIGQQAQTVSAGCQQAFRQRTAEICAASEIRNARPGTPTDLIRARAEACFD